MLHPQSEITSVEEEFNNSRDLIFIYEHIDEIDDEYRKYMQGNNGENTEKKKEDIIREIISKIERQISTEQIGKATKGAPIKAKREATQVERGEKDQEEIRRRGI